LKIFPTLIPSERVLLPSFFFKTPFSYSGRQPPGIFPPFPFPPDVLSLLGGSIPSRVEGEKNCICVFPSRLRPWGPQAFPLFHPLRRFLFTASRVAPLASRFFPLSPRNLPPPPSCGKNEARSTQSLVPDLPPFPFLLKVFFLRFFQDIFFPERS